GRVSASSVVAMFSSRKRYWTVAAVARGVCRDDREAAFSDFVGWVERERNPIAIRGTEDGFRVAQPILRSGCILHLSQHLSRIGQERQCVKQQGQPKRLRPPIPPKAPRAALRRA